MAQALLIHVLTPRRRRRAAATMLGVSLFCGAVPKKVKRNREHAAYLSWSADYTDYADSIESFAASAKSAESADKAVLRHLRATARRGKP